MLAILHRVRGRHGWLRIRQAGRPLWNTGAWMMIACILALGSVPASAEPLTAYHVSGWQIEHVLYTLLHKEVPAVLRHFDLVADPPEVVALQVLSALDRHDHQQLIDLADGPTLHLHNQLHAILTAWPRGALQRPGAWGSVGPFRDDPWYTPLPQGSIRRLAIEVTYQSSRSCCVVELRLGADGWRVVGLSMRK